MNPSHNPIILTYHSISDGRSPLKVAPGLFIEQMEWLRDHARVASLAEVVAAVVQKKPLPDHTVALTFDDGFEDFFSTAAPVLRRLRFPAAVFLPTAYCGRTNSWPGQPQWVDEQTLMSWKQIRELSGEGFSFGAHSVTHPILTEISPDEAEREIADSQREIEARTDRSVEFFCYPYGRWNSQVREMVQRQYCGACTTGIGAATSDSDPFALPRVDIHYLRAAAWFRRLFTPRLQSYLFARRWIRRLRGQPEGKLPRL